MEIKKNEPLIFLAGPIQGAPDWQNDAVSIMESPHGQRTTRTDTHVANPRRDYINEEFIYGAQVAWEKAGLQRAAKNGAIIFWFAAQDPSQPYEQDRAYAQTSRIEFGRVLGWHDYNPDINIFVGIDEGYKGSERYYKTCAEEKGLRVYSTLEGVTLNALSAVTEGR